MPDNPLLLDLYGGKSTNALLPQLMAQRVLAEPELFPLLFEGLSHEKPLIRMRSAYAISQITQSEPKLLQPYKQQFMERMSQPDNSQLAQACMVRTLPLLELAAEDMELVIGMYKDFLFSESSIVKAHALEFLAELSASDPELREDIMPLIIQAMQNGTPAMKVKARRALEKLGF